MFSANHMFPLLLMPCAHVPNKNSDHSHLFMASNEVMTTMICYCCFYCLECTFSHLQKFVITLRYHTLQRWNVLLRRFVAVYFVQWEYWLPQVESTQALCCLLCSQL